MEKVLCKICEGEAQEVSECDNSYCVDYGQLVCSIHHQCEVAQTKKEVRL